MRTTKMKLLIACTMLTLLTPMFDATAAAQADNAARSAADAMVGRFTDSWNRADGSAVTRFYPFRNRPRPD